MTTDAKSWGEVNFTPFPPVVCATSATPGWDNAPMLRQWEDVAIGGDPSSGSGSGGDAALGRGVAPSAPSPRLEWLQFLQRSSVALSVSLPAISINLTDDSYRALLLGLLAIDTPPSEPSAVPSTSSSSFSSARTSDTGGVPPKPSQPPSRQRSGGGAASVEHMLVAVGVEEGTINFVRQSAGRSLCLVANTLTTLVDMPMNSSGFMDVMVSVHSIAGITGAFEPFSGAAAGAGTSGTSSRNNAGAGAGGSGRASSDAVAPVFVKGDVVLHRLPTAPRDFVSEPMLVVKVKVAGDFLYSKKTVVHIGTWQRGTQWCLADALWAYCVFL